VARAAPAGYAIDIVQWDTHVGAIIFPINFDLQKDFTPSGLMTINPQVTGSIPARGVKESTTYYWPAVLGRGPVRLAGQ
jgi:hypothetical protein